MSFLSSQAYPKYTSDQKRSFYQRMKAGDADARNQLILSVMPLALRECKRSASALSSEAKYDSALQSVMHAVEKWDPTRGELSTIATWCVRRGLKNAARDASVAARRAERVYVRAANGWQDSASDAASDREQRRRKVTLMRAAIDLLSPRQQFVMKARMDGKKLREIAAMVGTSHQAVAISARRAADKIRGFLVGKL